MQKSQWVDPKHVRQSLFKEEESYISHFSDNYSNQAKLSINQKKVSILHLKESFLLKDSFVWFFMPGI